MKSEQPCPPGFWRTVRLLLGAARRRSLGRRRRQQQLLRNRAGGHSTDWSGLSLILVFSMMALINVGAAYMVRTAVGSGDRREAELQGKLVVSRRFLITVKTWELALLGSSGPGRPLTSSDYHNEAKEIVNEFGGNEAAVEQRLRDAVRAHGSRDLMTKEEASSGWTLLASLRPTPAMLGSWVLLLWGVMLVFQGDGLELDLMRRRHPMWEWLFTHPAPPGAIFFAEMLSPIAANPVYWGAPLFVGFLYDFIYGPALGVLAALLMGIPITIGAACLGKAFEIGVTLRFPARSRGAMIGLLSWMGYASMMFFVLSFFVLERIISAIGRFLDLFTVLPWPWLRLFLGGQLDGSSSFLSGALACWLVAGLTTAGAVWFSLWGAQRGLSADFGQADSRPSVSSKRRITFGKDPLYRKEFLWFTRDRSAIVQTILIPLTVAGFQLFNLRHLLSEAEGAWNYLCGAGILLGTYFLWTLGPKSLASEGAALWIALTWPRGLESLLKAKAWLWSLISSGVVMLVFCYAVFLHAASLWKIILVGVGWFFFGRSMAEKAVTLVSVPSSSGEPQPIPRGRRWATQLGTMTFSVGVLTQQWHVAIMGIVYSYVTAAAMWESFRARLPYLYDPWSEKLPPPPTLMHAMVSISILAEGGAVVTSIVLAMAGRENLAMAHAISYGISAVVVSLGVWIFLENRGVSLQDVWRWRTSDAAGEKAKPWWRIDGSRRGALPLLLLVGAIGGLVLGLFALGYVAVLRHIPVTGEIIRKAEEQMARVPGLRISFAVVGVGFAPFAEEYLFRGLLFRALDREWGGWRAVVGSAAFFAVYHPPVSWLPVALLGIANALLFKKGGRLVPAVVLHMVYNAVVLS